MESGLDFACTHKFRRRILFYFRSVYCSISFHDFLHSPNEMRFFQCVYSSKRHFVTPCGLLQKSSNFLTRAITWSIFAQKMSPFSSPTLRPFFSEKKNSKSADLKLPFFDSKMSPFSNHFLRPFFSGKKFQNRQI